MTANQAPNVMAPSPSFADHFADYERFSQATDEKQVSARIASDYLHHLSQKSLISLADLGMGDAKSLLEVLKHIANDQAQHVDILAKETDPDMINLAIHNMAARLADFRKTNFSITNGNNVKILAGELGQRIAIILEGLSADELQTELAEKLAPNLDAHWRKASQNNGRIRGFQYTTTLDIQHKDNLGKAVPSAQGFDAIFAFQAANASASTSFRAKNTVIPALPALNRGGKLFTTQAHEHGANQLYVAFNKAGINVEPFQASLADVAKTAREHIEQKGELESYQLHAPHSFDFDIIRGELSPDAYLQQIFFAMAYHAQVPKPQISPKEQSQAIDVLRSQRQGIGWNAQLVNQMQVTERNI